MKILIVKLSALGDVLVTTPFFRLIKEKYPQSEIHHLVMQQCAEATISNPWVDRQIVLDKIPTNKALKDINKIARLFFQLKKEHYDIAVIFHRNILFQLLCKASNVKIICGFESIINTFLDYAIPYRIDINRTLLEHKLLSECGIHTSVPDRIEFYPDNNKCKKEILEKLPQRFIACNPGGGNPYANANNRMWPIEYYACLIKNSKIPFVILGNGESDKSIVARLTLLVPDDFLNFVNLTNYHETAEILKRAEIYLGNDSSLLFLAAAMGTMTIGLYGPTQAVAANPLGFRQYVLLSNTPCSPCYNPFDGIKGTMYTCKNNICMKSISVQSVQNKLNELLS